MQLGKHRRQFLMCRVNDLGTSTEQVPTRAKKPGLSGEQRSKTTPHSISHDSRAERPTECVRNLRMGGVLVNDGNAPQRTRRDSPTALAQQFETRSIPNSMDQADSRARPRSRRALRMARPARVLMRCRKPCFFARRRLLGWKVLFTRTSSEIAQSGPTELGKNMQQPPRHPVGDISADRMT
jgi:hypothetical protein